MATTTNPKTETGHLAAAKALNLPISTKHCIEICSALRYKDVSYAKRYLEEVAQLRRAVPFKRFVMNMGHKKGMSTGRYPAKAALEVLKLLKSVEANAQFKGLNTSSLKITKLVANKASIPFTGARHRTATKRTHLEVEVKERGAGKKKAEPVAEKKKKEVPTETAVKHEHNAPTQPAPTHTHEHVHDHKHDPAHEHKHEHAPAKSAVKATVAEEPSSTELLRRAQQKAADLKRQEKERKETEQVTSLYEELQKKGSLRSAGVRK